jgi:hypothetical protein
MRTGIDATFRHIGPKKNCWRHLTGLQVRQNFGRRPAVLPAQGYCAGVKLIAIGNGMPKDLIGVKRPVCWSMRNCTILLLKTFAPNR